MLKAIPKEYHDSSKGTLKLLWEDEWRSMGITQVRNAFKRDTGLVETRREGRDSGDGRLIRCLQSLGWEHYEVHEPEPHILLFKYVRSQNTACTCREKRDPLTSTTQATTRLPTPQPMKTAWTQRLRCLDHMCILFRIIRLHSDGLVPVSRLGDLSSPPTGITGISHADPRSGLLRRARRLRLPASLD